MIAFASRRVDDGEYVPGLIVTSSEQAIGAAIDEILLMAECMPGEEIRDRVAIFLPLKGR